ncbi:EF-hand domain-containing protein [Cupriavidus sp. 2TAF22]|uniref:EF-hand domain-containing protein n=1 Tax=unclassified Cupriavidus TaxID=2640874 RepID=UPI003F9097CF
MKKMIAVLILCIVSAGASAQVAAPPAGGGARIERAMQQLQARFASANTTHDGKLTRDQAAAGMPMVASRFDEIDTQRAGYVTLAQIEEFMRQKSMAR